MNKLITVIVFEIYMEDGREEKERRREGREEERGWDEMRRGMRGEGME